MLSNFLIAAIRTNVPVAVGIVVGLFAKFGLKIDDAALVTLVTGLGTSAYWAVAYKVGERFPRLGWLLGKGTSPDYKAAA